jgi:hypothetical protein
MPAHSCQGMLCGLPTALRPGHPTDGATSSHTVARTVARTVAHAQSAPPKTRRTKCRAPAARCPQAVAPRIRAAAAAPRATGAGGSRAARTQGHRRRRDGSAATRSRPPSRALRKYVRPPRHARARAPPPARSAPACTPPQDTPQGAGVPRQGAGAAARVRKRGELRGGGRGAGGGKHGRLGGVARSWRGQLRRLTSSLSRPLRQHLRAGFLPKNPANCKVESPFHNRKLPPPPPFSSWKFWAQPKL